MSSGLERILFLLPLLCALRGVALILLGAAQPLTAVLVSGWGFIWDRSAWGTGKAQEKAENVGGLYMAAIQAAAMGAMVGGLAFDDHGSAGVFTLSVTSWVLSALIVLAFIRTVAGGRTSLAVGRAH